MFYFTSFSQPLARAINNQLASYYDNSVYGSTGSSRGDKYSYYWVTLQQDFPSVLVEMGFMSNPEEDAALRKADYQQKICCVIASSLSGFLTK